MKFFSFTTEISYTWIRDISNTYTYLNIPWLCDSKITLICLYLLQYNSSPSINYSDNGLLLLTDNIFQTLPPPPLSHLLIFTLSVGFLVFIKTLPFYLELESKGFNFTNFFFESSKTWYNNWHMLLTITTNNWYIPLTTATDDLFLFFSIDILLHIHLKT